MFYEQSISRQNLLNLAGAVKIEEGSDGRIFIQFYNSPFDLLCPG